VPEIFAGLTGNAAKFDPGRMDKDHLVWPFFAPRHRELAREFDQWVRTELSGFEQDEGGNGAVARRIFELLAGRDWLRRTLPQNGSKIDLRDVSLMREICAFSSAVADVALSEPWLGILPIVLNGSQELREELLPGYLSAAFCRRSRCPNPKPARMPLPSRPLPGATATTILSMVARPGPPTVD